MALWLVSATLGYNAIEAMVALWAGGVAHSIALLGFGFDSVIETAAASVLLWRLSVEARGADIHTVARAEHAVHRFVGVTFLLLATYVVLHAGWTLWRGVPPRESLPGIILAIASLILMPAVALAKLRAARELESPALRAEAKETLACCYLSFTLLLGLVGNAAAGWWWTDPLAALLMVPWLVHEGHEALECDGECS